MKSTWVFDRSDPSHLYPEWTEKELSLMIELWRELEANPTAYLHARAKSAGGFNKYVADQLSQQTNKTRTSRSIGSQRSKLYKVVHFINRFNEIQQVSGDRLWFDLPREERNQVISTSLRKTSSNLTQVSYNTLIKLKAVRKWAKVKKVILPKPKAEVRSKPKAQVRSRIQHPSKCSACWSTSDIGVLVRSWGHMMTKSNTSISDFMTQSYDESATVFTPWNHSTMSAWRKMKRIAASYLFIQAFNERYAPKTWFQLSDSAQNSRIDWNALPAEFEDISCDIFDEIHCVDSYGSRSPSSESENAKVYSVEAQVDERNPAKRTHQTFAGLFDDFSGDESDKSTFPENGKVYRAAAHVDEQSPTKEVDQTLACLFSDSSQDESDESSEEGWTESKLIPGSPHVRVSSLSIPSKVPKIAKRNHDSTAYDSVEELQKKHFKKTIACLRADIERDLRLSADMVRAIFFERFGDPGQSGDATFVSNILDEQQRQIRDRFTLFQREHFGATYFNTP